MREDDAWLRRHAVQIVAQLPENHADALAVLELAKRFVAEFLNPDHDLAESGSPAEVLPFPAAANSRCSAIGSPLSIPK